MKSRNLLIVSLLFLSVLKTGHAMATENAQNITLKKSIEMALANNLSLQLQQEDIRDAEGASLASKSKFDLLFSAELSAQSEEKTALYPGGAEQEDTGALGAEVSKIFTTGTAISLGWNNSSYDSDADGLLFNPSYSSGLTLGLTQPLLKGFGTKVQTAGVQAAEKQLAATSKEFDSQAADLAADVKKAYWNLVYNHQNIEVRKLSLTLAQKLLEETDAQINAGKLAPVEIYQPQSEVARREEELISVERSRGVADDDLKLLLNSSDWLVSFTPTDLPTTTPIDLDLTSIIQNALESRPDIKAAELRIRAAELTLGKAKDDMRPDLSVVGGIGLGGTNNSYGNAVEDNYNDPNDLWQVGVTFSIPLENSGAKGVHQQARASVNKAKTATELLKQQIRRTVRTTIRDVQLAIKALDATRKTSIATQKRLEAEQAKFDSGRATTLDVLTAQEAYAQSLSQENRTKMEYANSLAELDRIQGLITFSSYRQ